MAVDPFWHLQLTLSTVRSVAPSQSAVELAMDMVAVLDGFIAHLTRLGSLKFHLIIGAKPFQHRIKALTRPWEQGTKMGDGSPIVVLRDAAIGRLKLLSLGLGLSESSQLLLVIEPIAQRLSHGRIARQFDAPMESAPVEIAVEASSELIWEADTESLRVVLVFSRHRNLLIFQNCYIV